MNSVLWLLWAALLAVSVSLTRNPFYLAIAVLALASVWLAVESRRPLGRPAPRLPLLAAVFLLPWSTVVNALLAHVGDRVLVRLPPWPVVGGPITWNAVLYGALTGTALTCLLIGMSMLHAVLDRHELLRLVPPRQRALALTVAIALNALPSFAAAARDTVDVLRFRGQWRPLAILRTAVPAVLYRGMDYSLALAEVLEVRGFGTQEPDQHGRPFGWLLLLSGWFLVVGAAIASAGSLLLVGIVCLAAAGLRSARRAWPGLRTLPWSRAAWLVAATLLLAGSLFALSLRLPATDLAYSPYPTLRWPGFAPLAGLAYLALAIPALALGRVRR